MDIDVHNFRTDIWGQRFGADIIDSIVMWLVLLVPVVGFGTSGLENLGLLVGGGLSLGYWLLLEGLWGGYTVGKKFFGIRVVKEDGSECDLVASAIRNVLIIVDNLPTAYLVAIVSMYLSDYDQRVGDRAAKTVVVKWHS
jgi:uncharacterized RDD family membrane protein YckC